MKKTLCVAATMMFLGCGERVDSKLNSDLKPVHADEPGLLNPVTERVINGSIPKDGSYESVALLLSEANVSVAGGPASRRQLSICTATLISPSAILSAAHCVNELILKTAIERATGPDGKPLNAKIIGSIEFRVAFVRNLAELAANPASLLAVSRVDEHEDFALTKNPWAAFQKNPGKWHDVAIVHLAKPATGRRIQKLATAEQVNAEVSNASLGRQFAGYGLSDESNPQSAGTLMEGTAHLGEVGTNEFIAGADDAQVACHGDSGGPIYMDGTEDLQIGIASRINKKIGLGDIWDGITGNVKAPSCEVGLVYTRVDTYLDWIKKHVTDME
ncbi:MAG TPA: trypsin-like serine protease [Oligoflexus sp.]|uniref:S1 family peptidase n=1 Tax=Oligoflexus sp. TaxID=1971216 RepID=UPI002D6ABF8C|nr:trypsin-like serine protease [Oligoflexus sp.]HYX32850.1 trypsin-like serine protease [Oligoflexus sp.]